MKHRIARAVLFAGPSLFLVGCFLVGDGSLSSSGTSTTAPTEVSFSDFVGYYEYHSNSTFTSGIFNAIITMDSSKHLVATLGPKIDSNTGTSADTYTGLPPYTTTFDLLDPVKMIASQSHGGAATATITSQPGTYLDLTFTYSQGNSLYLAPMQRRSVIPAWGSAYVGNCGSDKYGIPYDTTADQALVQKFIAGGFPGGTAFGGCVTNLTSPGIRYFNPMGGPFFSSGDGEVNTGYAVYFDNPAYPGMALSLCQSDLVLNQAAFQKGGFTKTGNGGCTISGDHVIMDPGYDITP